jgi:methionyl-tRNA formyltransferase
MIYPGKDCAMSARQKIAFFGTPEFAAVQLRALFEIPEIEVVGVVTQPDRPAGRGQKLVASPVKQEALKRHIPILQPTSLKREGETVVAFAAQTGPWELGIVAAYGLIVPERILNLPKHGCVNVHASMLPRWRGAAPIHRAIMAGDSESGVCLMKMEIGLDTGPVLSSAATAINCGDTTGSLHERLAALGASLLKRDLMAIISGARTPVPQPSEGITYAEKISKEEARIEWGMTASEIARRVRALNPSPGAYTQIAGERVKIWECGVISKSRAHLPAAAKVGELGVVEDRLFIGTGEDTEIEIKILQPAGRNKVSAAEYLRGLGSSVPKSVDV